MHVSIAALPPGTYNLALFPWSTARGGFQPATAVRIAVKLRGNAQTQSSRQRSIKTADIMRG